MSHWPACAVLTLFLHCTLFLSVLTTTTLASPPILPLQCDASEPDCLTGEPDVTVTVPEGLTLAILGDQGLASTHPQVTKVLELVKSEGAHAVLHQGDLDTVSKVSAWEAQITAVLGDDFPYFASVGNHDAPRWLEGSPSYSEVQMERFTRMNLTTCRGATGRYTVCSFQGLLFVLSSVGVTELDDGITQAEHTEYLTRALAEYPAVWRVCSWHKNQHAMQLGTKPDEVGWGVYEACRHAGAFIVTGHEHSYARSHLLHSFPTQNVTYANTSLPLVLGTDHSFATVSGVAGKPPRACSAEARDSPWWAQALCSNSAQPLLPGALFCRFNVDGDPRKARCEFKQAEDGAIRDSFVLLSRNADYTGDDAGGWAFPCGDDCEPDEPDEPEPGSEDAWPLSAGATVAVGGCCAVAVVGVAFVLKRQCMRSSATRHRRLEEGEEEGEEGEEEEDSDVEVIELEFRQSCMEPMEGSAEAERLSSTSLR